MDGRRSNGNINESCGRNQDHTCTGYFNRPGGRFEPSCPCRKYRARLLKALADPTRLRILSLLSRHEGEVCVFEIVESFTLEQPTISHHLRILRDAGLVDCRKRGLWAYYYVRREALSRAQDVINGLA